MPNSLVTVKDPSGELGTIAHADLQKALDHGYVIPDNSEIQDHNDQLQFGSGLANPLKAFAESAAGTATFGVSRQLENATGLTTPEAQAARAKYNPTANTLGGVAGILAPLGIEGAVAEKGLAAADLLNPVAGAAKIGVGVGDVAASAAPGFAQNVVRAGAKGATEGALFGAGQAVNENAMGDPGLNGEKLFQHIGYGALLGGGVGSAFGLAEDIVPKAVDLASDALTKAKDSLLGAEGEVGPLGKLYAKTSSFVSGKPEESILEGLKQRASLIDNPEEREKIASNFANSLEDHFSNINKALKAANSEARGEEIQSLLKEVPADLAKQQSSSVFTTLDSALEEMKAHGPLYPSSVPYKLQGLRDEFVKMTEGAENAADVYNSINWLKTKIDEKFPVWGKMIPPEWKDAVSLLKGVRAEFKQNLENESIWGEAGARQSAFNDAQNRFLTVVNKNNAFAKAFLGKSITRTGQILAEVKPSKVKTFLSQINTLRSEAKAHALDDFFEASKGLIGELENTYKNVPNKTFNKGALEDLVDKNRIVSRQAQEQASLQKNLGMLSAGGHNAYLGEAGALFAGMHHPALGATIEAINVLRNPGLSIQRLAKIEAAVQKTGQIMSKTAKSIFRGSTTAGKELSGYIGGAESSGPKKLSAEEHDKRQEKIADFVNDPETASIKLGETTKHLYASAPQITSSLQSTTARASQFLSSKMQVNSAGPLDKPLPLSGAQMAQFDRYYQTIENPLSVMGTIKDGSISPEQVETLNAVYPQLYQEMKSHVMDAMMDHVQLMGRGMIPYKTKMGLSAFIGQPLDPSLFPQSVMSNQMTYAIAPKPNEGMKPSKQGMQKMTLADRTGIPNGQMEG